MSIEKLEERWGQFLLEARRRFEQTLAESVRDCGRLFDGAGTDAATVLRAWTAMRIRVEGLRAKVEEVWRAQVRASYEATGDFASCEAAEAQGEALRNWMEIEIQKAETRLFASLAQRLLDEARAEAAGLRCRACDQALDLGPSVRSRAVECPSCGRLNTLEGSAKARLAVEVGPYLWREACWDLWVAKQQAGQLVRRSAEVTLAQLKAWEQAEIDYLCAWVRERAKLLGQLDASASADDTELRSQLEDFYAGLECEPAWTAAGSPRTPVESHHPRQDR